MITTSLREHFFLEITAHLQFTGTDLGSDLSCKVRNILHLEFCLHIMKFSPKFITGIPTDIILYLRIEIRAKWMTDPFAATFYSPIQNNIGENIGDGIYFVTCEQTFRCTVPFIWY